MTGSYCAWCGDLSPRKWCSQRCKDLGLGRISHCVRPSACITCEAPLELAEKLRKIRYYCSPACNPRQTWQAASPPAKRECEECRSQFVEAVNNRGRQRFCSRGCFTAANNRRLHPWRMYDRPAGPPPPRLYRYARPAGPPAPKPCPLCGLLAPGNRRGYCSEDCYNVFGRRGGGSCKVFFPDCVECAGPFTAQRQAKFCSERCAKRFRKRQRRYLRRGKNGGDPTVTLQAVAERDGWRCHLCGLKVNSRHQGRDRDPTIDHLVPVSDGGTHTWDNVALAHNRCNWERGADGAAQLRLVG